MPTCTQHQQSDVDSGHNLVDYVAGTADDCELFCAFSAGCQSYTLDNNHCYLHPETGPLSFARNFVAGVCPNSGTSSATFVSVVLQQRKSKKRKETRGEKKKKKRRRKEEKEEKKKKKKKKERR